MVAETDESDLPFELGVQLMNGSTLELPVSNAEPLFIVGPNGAGKSGLMLSLFRQNPSRAVRIAAHRQTWMESNSVPFSPQDKINNEKNARAWDSQPQARWVEVNPGMRSGLIIADLIDADNSLSRSVRQAVKSGKRAEAKHLAQTLPPLEVVNELFAGSGIPIEMTIEANNSIVARKRGGSPYSIAALSDGERAALLIAGMILNAQKNSLILVDEPERHLHSSIVTPLLMQLFAKRTDCIFVVSTHELGLPVSCPGARTVLVRDSKTVNDNVTEWDLDILESGVAIDDTTKEAIIGARRKMLFIEGTADSLDKPLYELLFPGVTIFPRETCGEVEHAVISLRDASTISWIKAWGIVDQDQLTADKKSLLEAKGVFALSVYSVESLYYDPAVVEAIAKRQTKVIGGDQKQMIAKAWDDVLATIANNVDRLSARMTEQLVKDNISLQMPDWKKIQGGHRVAITVDSEALYQSEKKKLQGWITSRDVEKIVARYPIRETPALMAVVGALQFKNRAQYESAVRKLLVEDPASRMMLLGKFGGLPTELNGNISTRSKRPKPT